MARPRSSVRLVLSHLPEPSFTRLSPNTSGSSTRSSPAWCRRSRPNCAAADPSLILVEPYKELPVDRDAFVGPIPAIVGMIPYRAVRVLHRAQAVHPQRGPCHARLPRLSEGLRVRLRGAGRRRNLLPGARRDGRVGAGADAQVPTAPGEPARQHRRPAPPLRQPGARRHHPAARPRPAAQACAGRPAGGRGRERGRGESDCRPISSPASPPACTSPTRPILCAQELQAKIRALGIEKTLAEVTGISPDDRLGREILERYEEIQRR